MLGKRIKHSKTETPGSSRKRSSLKADQSERPQFLVSLVDRFLSLQRTIGNHTVAQFVKTNIVLPSLGGSKNVAVQREEVNPSADRDTLPREEISELNEYVEEKEENLGTKTSAGNTMQPESPYSKVDWGRRVDSNDSDIRKTASNSSQETTYWGASAAAISSMIPQPIHWGSNNSMSQAENEKKGFNAIGSPEESDLGTVQSHANKGAVGHTEKPSGYRAPDFQFNTWDADVTRRRFGAIPVSLHKGLVPKTAWYARPTLTETSFEGNAKSFYTKPGTYPTEYRELGKTVYWHFSADVSDKIRTAELEHCEDFKYAYKISLKEAEEVLRAKVIVKQFGPAPTEVAAKQMVLDAIEDNLVHKQLGNDKTKWEGRYQELMWTTLLRDEPSFINPKGRKLHRFPIDKGTRKAYKKRIKYSITAKHAKINQVPSSAIIKYEKHNK